MQIAFHLRPIIQINAKLMKGSLIGSLENARKSTKK